MTAEQWLLVTGAALYWVAWWRLLRRMGYMGILSLVMLIPGVNLWFMFRLVTWDWPGVGMSMAASHYSRLHFKPYTDEELGFSTNIPMLWERKHETTPDGQQIIRFIPKDNLPVRNITVAKSLSGDMSPMEYAKAMLDYGQQQGIVAYRTPKEASIGGSPGAQWIAMDSLKRSGTDRRIYNALVQSPPYDFHITVTGEVSSSTAIGSLAEDVFNTVINNFRVPTDEHKTQSQEGYEEFRRRRFQQLTEEVVMLRMNDRGETFEQAFDHTKEYIVGHREELEKEFEKWWNDKTMRDKLMLKDALDDFRAKLNSQVDMNQPNDAGSTRADEAGR